MKLRRASVRTKKKNYKKDLQVSVKPVIMDSNKEAVTNGRGGKTMNPKEKEMRQEAKERIIECLENGYTGYYCELHNEVFNTDYYIIGTNEAKEALEEYDVFEAIEKVQTYEEDNFGEIFTDLSDPEKLINMLFYVIGEEVFWEMLNDSKTWNENWDNRANEETNAKILKELGE